MCWPPITQYVPPVMRGYVRAHARIKQHTRGVCLDHDHLDGLLRVVRLHRLHPVHHPLTVQGPDLPMHRGPVDPALLQLDDRIGGHDPFWIHALDPVGPLGKLEVLGAHGRHGRLIKEACLRKIHRRMRAHARIKPTPTRYPSM